MPILRVLILPICLLVGGFGLLAVSPLAALEEETTTAELIRSVPYVAHVRVETVKKVPGPFTIKNYEVLLLENLKGKLPLSFDVRILERSRIAHPSGRRIRPGQEWILILGRKNSQGIYPLRSLTWGKIELLKHPETGEFFLLRPVTGFAGKSAERLSLQQFRARVQKLLGRSGGNP
jgi:hypothetical protein